MPAHVDSDRLRSMAVALRAYLVRARAAADGEIRTYPTPIPRCDAQFNFVYEQRARLTELLNQVNAALDCEDAAAALSRAIEAFIRASSQGASSEENDLRERLAADLWGSDATTRRMAG